MKILDDGVVLDFLHRENGPEPPAMSTKQIQIHLDFKCGCKITQDNRGNGLEPCKAHLDWANDHKDNIILHKNLH